MKNIKYSITATLTVVLAISILVGTGAVSISAQTKHQTPEQRDEFFKQEIAKAKWVFFIKDEDDIPYYIDSLAMSRTVSVVIFITKSTKRGTTEYNKIIGGCTKDIIAITNTMVSNPGVKELMGGEIKDPPFNAVTKGTIGYMMLDYVCKNAKVETVE